MVSLACHPQMKRGDENWTFTYDGGGMFRNLELHWSGSWGAGGLFRICWPQGSEPQSTGSLESFHCPGAALHSSVPAAASGPASRRPAPRPSSRADRH